jgi:GH15 family glucan-1,4-alpha-glucosidase
VNRIGGYAPLRDYAAIGDGRTVALVARDGSIDWLCLPNLDSPITFGAILDADAGGRFELCPAVPSTVARRYVPGTNVLETIFTADSGTVRVRDALTLPLTAALSPQRELVRQVEAVAGSVPMRWALSAGPAGGARARLENRGPVPLLSRGDVAVAVCSWNAGDVALGDGMISGEFIATSTPTLLALTAAHQEPLVFPARADVEARLAHTLESWREWSARLPAGIRWTDPVQRSALALKLLVFAPSGAIAAAATTSLPEVLGGERNWDYRYCWVRDSAFLLNALLGLGCVAEAEAFFSWLMHASQLTHPHLRVLYRLDGGARAREKTLPLSGYRNSAPVRVGNDAAGQLQLDVYGDLLQTAWLYAQSGARIDPDVGHRLGEVADLVCQIWHRPDAGLWEVRSEPEHFTQSKMMCAIALDRAVALADLGAVPASHAPRWRETSGAIRTFVEEHCWSAAKQAYVRSASSEDLDASVLLAVLFGYHDPRDPRLYSTVDAIRRELASGSHVRRYASRDGLDGEEGAFLTCSFWLVEALARQERRAEATELMDDLVGLANDVGLYAEEIDPATGAFLGNMPQALTHLALIRAALALEAIDRP